ncbi:GMC family oxidoreductase [Frigidibacter oleivorans]|uniref:GMC family oxidoreductase n=1 Tax=Frigidibacter oleivorans TaxID=2487129 RepID=UPI000F8DBB81|nr:GMC family oxidoreductase N-terminal domain-containing protein [Frigidibacter oleivorans]
MTVTDEDFDYIIVGAGSAGCVLAERLTASGRYRVLLLEAGGSDLRLFVQMPLGYGKLFYDTGVNWAYRAEPDPGLAGQADYWPRGKVLGGSSSINAMVWIRGHRSDYDDWRDAGNPGWGWDAVLPAFRAIEDWEGGADDWRGQGGPLHISANRAGLHPLTHAYVAACAAAGLPETPDFNGAQQEGAGIYQLTVKGGRRMSAARAFLRPALRRRNLVLRTRAQATGLIWEGNRVTGVTYRHRGGERRARAGREVILAAGAVNTPQLLLLSGIGPGAELRAMGLDVRHDNPNVGQHLMDHQGLNYTWRMTVPTLNQQLRPWWGKALAGARWLLTGAGPLSMSINQGGGFFRTDPALDRPNMQLYMQAFSTIIPRVGERPVLTPDPFPGLSLGLSNCRPSSRGWIRLASADPFAAPRIQPNAFSTEGDVAEMLAAVKFLRRIAAAPPLAGLIAEELRPGPATATDEELIADFRLRSGTVYHASGTARMGPDPAGAVVDARLRVHGVPGLRVADASIFPTIPGGNTNAPAILVGWKAAEMVLEDAR